MSLSWTGIYPALTTPFLKDESIDFVTLERKIQSQITSGVHALILAGSLGEAGVLTREEKLDLLRCAKDVAGAQFPIILNVAESRTKDALSVIRLAQEAGADGFMVLPPMRYVADDREVLTWFSTIAQATDLPLMVYNNPVDYRVGLSLTQLESLLQYPTIQAIKESTRDVTQVIRLHNAFGQRLKILCGVDTLALESLLLGADGWVAGLVNAFPKETMALYRHALAGRWEEARKLYAWFMPLLELDIHPKLVQYIKLAEQMTGEGTAFVRTPRLSLEGDELNRITQIISRGIEHNPGFEV